MMVRTDIVTVNPRYEYGEAVIRLMNLISGYGRRCGFRPLSSYVIDVQWEVRIGLNFLDHRASSGR